MGLDDPICGVVGTVTTCAVASAANAEKITAAVTDLPSAPGEEVIFMGLVSFQGLAKMPPNIARRMPIYLHKMLILIKIMDNVII